VIDSRTFLIRGTTRLTAVIGWPVDHSRSPQMLNAAFAAAGIDAVMVPLGVEPEEFALAIGGLRAARALGASVTVPHKLAAFAIADELSPDARAIGAVNCLHFIDDRVIGHNTDAAGFVDGLTAAGLVIDDRSHVVLLGAGGAARAVAYGLRDAKSIEVIARRPDEVEWVRDKPISPLRASLRDIEHGRIGEALASATWDPTKRDSMPRARVTAVAWTDAQLRESFARANLVVDCTPIGLGGADEATLVDALPVVALKCDCWVATLVYHRPTILLQRAHAQGHSIVDGQAMLVHQGARAFVIWTGMPAPIDEMARALDLDQGT
jgi:shikimate dehydrogenase